MFSDNNGIKLEINYKTITGKSPYTWKFQQTLLNPWVKEISRKIRKYFEQKNIKM